MLATRACRHPQNVRHVVILKSRRLVTCQPQARCLSSRVRAAAADSEPDAQPEDDPFPEFEGLLPEDDWEVPGSDLGSLSLNTELGRAVDSAIDELDVLGGVENSVLQEADAILKRMGYTKSVFDAPPTPSSDAVVDAESN